jgi:catechol 2,3-dioxygenase-like lactoylglutathione lyase family enzyme
MPKLDGVLETSLYTDDLERARRFYEQVLGLSPLYADERMSAYAVGGQVLLLFKHGASAAPVIMRGGTIPGHDGLGPLHAAFAISADQLEGWTKHFKQSGIALEGRVIWPRGGESVYFRDPDGHLLELATPGLWANY